MNKKFWTGFIAVFVVMEILMFIIHGVILASTYQEFKNAATTSWRLPPGWPAWRPDMESLMWVYHVLGVIGAFFLTLVFSKGYEGKGATEGIRYGLYIGIWMSAGMAYGSYAMINIPYSLALQWFIYGVIEYVIYGIVLASVYGKQAMVTPVSKA